MIEWTEQFSVGIRKLDHQHQQLFTMVNDLTENHGAVGDSQLIGGVLKRMTEYADYHFKTEERVMMEYGYPEYPKQVSEHAEFRTKTAAFYTDAFSGKASLSRELLDYMQRWLISHILESDAKFKDFLIANGFLPNDESLTPELGSPAVDPGVDPVLR